MSTMQGASCSFTAPISERLQSVLTGIQKRLQSEREALLLRNRHLAAASRWAANAKALQ